MENEDNKVVPPADDSSANDTKTETEETSVEDAKTASEETDFDKELEKLEGEDTLPAPAKKPTRSELERAMMTAKSIAKRIKTLGGDPTEIISDVEPEEELPPEKPVVDTSQFVTRLDMSRAEAQKLAKSPSELKLMMWWVVNKGLSVDDAHFMANKGKIKKAVGEVTRAREATPANPGGGAGQAPALKTDAPALSDMDRKRLLASNMVYDPAKKAYVGKHTQFRWTGKEWVNERI